MHNEIEWKISNRLIPYQESLDFMEKHVAQIIAGKAPQLIWILEHPPIYTAGISAKDCDMLDQNLLIENSSQNSQNPKIIKVNRGGKYTYHCPGMKIIYVLLDLKKFFAPQAPDISRFVKFLENWVIEILGEYQIKGEIREKRVGIWVKNPSKNPEIFTENDESKIAAIGIKLKKWVSYHGIAVNLNCDLSGFSAIVPCGLKEFGVTSIAKIGGNLLLDFNQIAKKKFEEEIKKLKNPQEF